MKWGEVRWRGQWLRERQSSGFRFTGLQKKEKYFKTILNMGIDDSKRLKNIDRVRLLPYIEQYFYTGIGEATVAEINRLGIVKAPHLAMRRAVIRIKNQELRIKNKFFI